MGNLFKTKTPRVKDPAPIPDEMDTVAARKRQVAAATKGTGVTSTILSSGQRETLGG